MKHLTFILTVLISVSSLFADELYKQFQPAKTSRTREAIEWSNFRANATNDETLPRVLLIGDSIVAGYNGKVAEKLKGKMNVSFWASSKCVTDRDYFRELDLVLGADEYDVISFNNGLHSLSTDRAEWEFAYTQAVKFIRVKCPKAKLFLTTSTPLKDPNLTEKAKDLNVIVWKTAEAEKLPVIDLFSLMDPLDRNEYWIDTFHYRAPGIEMEAEKIAQTVKGSGD
ncbi:MAG: SGNH/GDSL hydrolase family protein [Thermoguttaceae bacterium]|nr:SGNH/GDSL hydrolase family protein [Thermoguttaceae bacterium]